MKKLTYFLIIGLFLISCGEKDDNIYNNANDFDQKPDSNSETEEEGGCGPERDDPENKPDADTTEDADISDDSDLNDGTVATDDDLTEDTELTDDTDITEDSDLTEPDDEIIDDYDTPCPPDMVESGNICIDRYEASRSDATETDQGTATNKAFSKPGVLPWMVRPLNNTYFDEFKAACTAVGKRLCRDDEWTTSCKGPEELTYSWGNTWDRKICNNVDTFCDEYCAQTGIPEAECNKSSGCGYDYYCFKVVPTGSFENCKNDAGAFDINGNVWETTDTGSGYATRGGAFNCAGAESRLTCTFKGWTDLYAGFRCCKDKK